MQDETTFAAVREIYTKAGVRQGGLLSDGVLKYYYAFEPNCGVRRFHALEECNLTPEQVGELASRIAGRSCVVLPWFTYAVQSVHALWSKLYRASQAELGRPKECGVSYGELYVGGLYVGRADFVWRVVFVVYLDESGIDVGEDSDGLVSDEELDGVFDGID